MNARLTRWLQACCTLVVLAGLTACGGGGEGGSAGGSGASPPTTPPASIPPASTPPETSPPQTPPSDTPPPDNPPPVTPPPVAQTFSVSGTVSGLATTQVTLEMNGRDDLVVSQNGPFKFAASLESGSSYQITVAQQPFDPAETCVISNSSGVVQSADIANVTVACTKNDQIAPTVSSTAPVDSAASAALQLPITATFSEPVKAATLTINSFTVTGPGGPVSGTVSLNGAALAQFAPSSPLSFNTVYEVRLTTAVRDLSDNPLAHDVVWTFNTGPQLALGADFGCVRFPAGQLKCWGNNASGQLGLGNTASRGDSAGEMGAALPTVNLGTNRIPVEIVAGGGHACARLDDGQVKCWGSNVYGQLGLGDTAARGAMPGQMGDSLPAVSLGAGAIVAQLSAGRYFTCVRLADGRVKCWGRNDVGQLGVGDMNSRGDQAGEMGSALASIDLGAGRRAIDIRTTAYHICAFLDDHSVKCWGENIYGQLGLGDANNRGDSPGEMGDALPVLNAGSGRTIKQLAVNSGHTCAVLDTRSVKCWGHNLYGQLGQGDTEFRGDDPGEVGDAVPTVDLGTGLATSLLVMGSRQTCALFQTHQVKCWGWNDFGELGLGDVATRGDQPGEMGDFLPFVNLGSGRTVVELASGSFFECARLDDAEIKCWGRNDMGQLGLGDARSRGGSAGEMGDNLPGVDFGL